MNKKDANVDQKLVDKYLSKYGYAIDMALLIIPYEKLEMSKIVECIGGLISKGGLKIRRHCDVEEFVENSYSSYRRRFGRVPRTMILEQFGDLYKDTYEKAHKAFIADRPNTAMNDDQLMIDLGGSHIDHDNLCNPAYISVQKVYVTDTITSVKVSYNSILRKSIWPAMIDINLSLGAVLSKLYNCDCTYGRATSLSLQNEIVARISHGKTKDIVAGKGELQEELRLYGTDINKIMDQIDANVGALHATRELRVAYDAIENICNSIGVADQIIKLINRIETHVIPKVSDTQSMPRFFTLYKFCRDFIISVTDTLGEKGSDGDAQIDEVNTTAASLASAVSSYIMYNMLLNKDPLAEMEFLILDKNDNARMLERIVER